ncbi:HD domain-containing protein [Oceanotoga sp. DSM 15011]|uniref:Ppx/GppA phosphatase family protein n=1 Tax=Oceanotoga sp. DSM 15011 TaxID=2984951 RepID=UPI0021F48340|nr:HD domain-containing protein [Oceanotoga sp. DSM 15011]UYO99371.1 HD domain-containing protein [Oceanotoga sp. DSM 15011]
MDYETSAVINIASKAIIMKIAYLDKEDNIIELEKLEKPLNLGIESFNTGRISYEIVEEICFILKNFRNKLKEYGVKKVKVIATTALREAKNSKFIIEQIKSRTKFNIDVLDDNEEKTIIYKQMIRIIENDKNFKNSNIILSYIGTGSLGIMYYLNGEIKFNHNIKVGTIKLAQILKELNNETISFYSVVDQYLRSFGVTLQNSFKNENVNYFFITGREIRLISKLIDKNYEKISINDFNTFIEDIKNKTINQINEKYSIINEKPENILATLAIYKMLLSISKVNNMKIFNIGLIDSILYEILKRNEYTRYEEDFEEKVIKSAYYFGEKYHFDKIHAKNVEKYALIIFNEINNIHKLKQRDRFLLRIASILHDIGKFINLKNHAYYSYEIIKASDLPGLNIKDIEVVSNIARLHSKNNIDINEETLKILTNKERIRIAKLLSILRIADALDRSHTKKTKEIDLKNTKNKIIINVYTTEDMTLEEWTFNKKSEFFQEVFGKKIILQKVVK